MPEFDAEVGKSSWISRIGSTVMEGSWHAEQVTVEVREPAKVESAGLDTILYAGKNHLIWPESRRKG